MVIGSGGREHAIVKKLLENDTIEEIFVLPGNGGMAKEATCIPIKATDIEKITEFAAKNDIGFAVVTPDDPLALGAVDALEAMGIPAFGPYKAAAEIESSKAFAKALMKKYAIPTAAYEVFCDTEAALEYIKDKPLPIVIKADGLALGKGVIIANTHQKAENAIISMLEDGAFGASGRRIVIEEFLTGPEVSVLTFTDGKTIVPMVSSMDHKRIGEGDTGLNTGGMGTIAPNPYYTEDIAKTCMETIFLPTMNAMNAEGRPFKGCLYFGLMLTNKGPMVIEYNCRFGDPETQVVLSLLETDLFDIMRAVRDERLSDADVRFSNKHACCVIMASSGYPSKYESGFEITLPDSDVNVFIAGARLDDGKLLTAGGRVLGVTATADTLEAAIKKAYDATEKTHFKNAYFRRDIGSAALNALR